jgi:N-acetyl-gamma-glutamyl-phosphate reductase
VTTSVGIVGFRGYSGAEVVRILRDHAHVETVLLEHRSDAGAPALPRGAKRPRVLPCSVDSAKDAGLTAVFLATHAEVSMELTPGLLEAGIKVIDLSGAFRLRTPENFKRWYGSDHLAPQLLSEAAYGLPELCRERIRSAQLLSNPGCYPTAANLAIRPLVQAELIDRSAGVVCDAKSGVSGAGRKPALNTSFCEVAENFSAYSLLEHRHVPEVLMNSGLEEHEFSFVAQLIPIDRGILETIYFRGTPSATADRILAAYDSAYHDAPFVRTYEHGIMPDLHAVQRTNFCDIGVKYDERTRRGVIVAVIDNLVKGAAGQAIQNMNLMLGFAEQEALL